LPVDGGTNTGEPLDRKYGMPAVRPDVPEKVIRAVLELGPTTPVRVDDNVIGVPPLGVVCVILIANVVPGVMVAPVPVVAVCIWPRLANVVGSALRGELVTPEKVIDI
jgi:hypothetical protein